MQRWDACAGAVISSRRDAAGLESARARGIATHAIDHRDYGERSEYEAALRATIEAYTPDLVVLAGYMRVLSAGFVRAFDGRMVNVHPSLLPAFPGLLTHRAALAAGVKLHGATVHLVTADLDAGPIISQATLEVREDDDERSLAARVLELEHRIYPAAVRALLEDRVSVDGAQVRVREIAQIRSTVP